MCIYLPISFSHSTNIYTSLNIQYFLYLSFCIILLYIYLKRKLQNHRWKAAMQDSPPPRRHECSDQPHPVGAQDGSLVVDSWEAALWRAPSILQGDPISISARFMGQCRVEQQHARW